MPTALINGEANPELTKRFQIGAYPAIYLFREGLYQVYDGERNSDSIFNWVKRKTGSDSTALANCDELQGNLTKELTVVYFGAYEGDLYNAFVIASKSNEKFQYFHVLDAECSIDKYNGP